jgi:N-acetylmuramoyl-L-alanine amidase
MKFINIVALFLLIINGGNSLAFAGGENPKRLQQKHTLQKIVIDAGHGGSSSVAGKFYGASSKFGEEKDVTLAIALKLQDAMKEEMPEVEVYMTRTTDVFDHVVTKAKKANTAKGDLFISIHCNDVSSITHHEVVGYTTKTVKRRGKKITKKIPQYRTWTTPNPAKGTETYIWGVGKTKDKEDALIENDFVDTTSGVLKDFDPNDPAQKVAISLRTEQYAERSRNLALTVEDEFVKSGRVSRGAKQRDEKGIWVLQAVAMPAILIEVGFLSNQEEGEYITSESGQKEIAEAIVKALKRYKYSLDNKLSGGKS